MFSLLSNTRGLFNHPWRKGVPSSWCFVLGTKYTSSLVLFFCMVLAAGRLVGDPIECTPPVGLSPKLINYYCWMTSTYSVVPGYSKPVGVEVPYHGVMSTRGIYQGEAIRHHRFYQWVPLCLLFQAVLFYMPRWFWKHWEGGKIHALMMNLQVGICSEVEKKQKKKLLLDYLWENLRYHNWWCYRYYFCEILSLVNVVGQMFLMNRFFDGAFLTFGIDVLTFLESDQEERVDPMIYIFPRMTKCTFYKYGVSGEVERHDAVCILPLNVVNEKIYVFLWFWFLILGFVTVALLLYRLVIILSPRIRVYVLTMRFKLVGRDALDAIVRRSKMGDWFLLYMLGDNIDSVVFRDVVHELANRLGSPSTKATNVSEA